MARIRNNFTSTAAKTDETRSDVSDVPEDPIKSGEIVNISAPLSAPSSNTNTSAPKELSIGGVYETKGRRGKILILTPDFVKVAWDDGAFELIKR